MQSSLTQPPTMKRKNLVEISPESLNSNYNIMEEQLSWTALDCTGVSNQMASEHIRSD